MIYQSEAAECGLMCIAMIAGYHGHEVDLAHMRSSFHTSTNGVTLQRITEAAQAVGLSAEAIRIDLDSLGEITCPAILHWRMTHFVVLKSFSRGTATVYDPAVGIRRVKLKALSESFTGVALTFSRTASFLPRKGTPRVSLRRMFGAVRGLNRALLQIGVFAIFLEISSLLSPLFLQLIADQVVARGDFGLLNVLGTAFLIIKVVQSIIGAARSWAVVRLGTNLGWLWSTTIFSHLLSLPEDFYQRRKLGEIISRFGSISAIQQTVTSRFVEVVLDGLMAIGTIFVLLAYQRLLAFVAVAVVIVYTLLRVLSYPAFREANLSQLAADANQQSIFLESLRGARAIRLHNKGAVQAGRYATLASVTVGRFVAVQRLAIFSALGNSLLIGVQQIITLWLGCSLVVDGYMTIGMLVAVAGYSAQFTQRSISAIDYLFNLKMLRMHTDRLSDIMLSRSEQDVHGSGSSIDAPLSIELVNVSYRYSDGDPWILRSCSFRIDPGESVAIVGASGAGKTTLLKIILGLLSPEEGEILIAGTPLNRIGRRPYRDRIGVVMEDDELFSGTLAQNICFFEAGSSLERISTAAMQASVHDEILRLPMGYETLVGDMGSTLSGGQRQRILLARALYRRPELLLLDEATSRLDSANESRVNEAIRGLKMTRVLIAHRKETIASADRQIYISGGAAVASLRTRATV